MCFTEKSLVAVLKRCQFLTSSVWCFLGHSTHVHCVENDELALCLLLGIHATFPLLPLCLRWVTRTWASFTKWHPSFIQFLSGSDCSFLPRGAQWLLSCAGCIPQTRWHMGTQPWQVPLIPHKPVILRQESRWITVPSAVALPCVQYFPASRQCWQCLAWHNGILMCVKSSVLNHTQNSLYIARGSSFLNQDGYFCDQ